MCWKRHKTLPILVPEQKLLWPRIQFVHEKILKISAASQATVWIFSWVRVTTIALLGPCQVLSLQHVQWVSLSTKLFGSIFRHVNLMFFSLFISNFQFNLCIRDWVTYFLHYSFQPELNQYQFWLSSISGNALQCIRLPSIQTIG